MGSKLNDLEMDIKFYCLKVYTALFLILILKVNAQAQDTTGISDSSSMVMVIAGDIMGHDGQISGAYVDSTGKYNYEPTFRHIKDYFSEADIAIANLEVTLAGKPFKGYPQFSSPDELAIAARDAGVDIMLTANNHSLDRGAKGLTRTISVLDSLNLAYTGTFLSQKDRDTNYPLIFEKNNIKVALLNYTYGTNGLKVNSPFIVNRIDTATIRKDLLKAKVANPDFICVTIHWGLEYKREENVKQQRLAKFMFEHGAHAIVGSHPHVVQPIKYVDVPLGDSIVKRPVYYSLGNFVSNQRAQYKDGGIVAELHLSKKGSVTNLDAISYLPYWVYREDKNKKSTFYVVPVAKYEFDSTIVNFNESSLYRFNRFKNDTRTHLKGVPESDFYLHKAFPVSIKPKEPSLEVVKAPEIIE